MIFYLHLLSESYSILFLAHPLLFSHVSFFFQHIWFMQIFFLYLSIEKHFRMDQKIVQLITQRDTIILTIRILHILFLHLVSHSFCYTYILLLAHSITHSSSVVARLSIIICFFVSAHFSIPTNFFSKF